MIKLVYKNNGEVKMKKGLLKWAGGKEKELDIILQSLPESINRYIEPFVGGGAVYFNINIKESYINDKSKELILLYKLIKKQNKNFFYKLEEINKCWILLNTIVDNNKEALIAICKNYLNYDQPENETIGVENAIYSFVISHANEFNGLLSNEFNIDIDNFIEEIIKRLIYKIKRIKKLEYKYGKMNENDILENVECAFKSAFYLHFRYLYNDRHNKRIDEEFASAIFYFIREFTYASMFRYNSKGEFNVPYGGISYNHKDMTKKIEYLKSKELHKYLQNTEIYELDFEDMFNIVKPRKGDFIFLDPPYDSEFSTYAQNEFTLKDHERLANYLSHTKAYFMLIIKNTDYIHNLYNNRGFYIHEFDKKYLVSFRNRNKKDVTHLIITNYE